MITFVVSAGGTGNSAKVVRRCQAAAVGAAAVSAVFLHIEIVAKAMVENPMAVADPSDTSPGVGQMMGPLFMLTISWVAVPMSLLLVVWWLVAAAKWRKRPTAAAGAMPSALVGMASFVALLGVATLASGWLDVTALAVANVLGLRARRAVRQA